MRLSDVPVSSAAPYSLQPTGPIAHLELDATGTPDFQGFLPLTVSLHNSAGEQVRTPPDSRAHIEVGLEPPRTRLEGRCRRQAFGGQATFRLRLGADVGPGDVRLRVALADDSAGPRALFDVCWPKTYFAGTNLPPPGPDPQTLVFSDIDDVHAGQTWRGPIIVWLCDAFNRICPTADAPPVVVELRLGQAGRGLEGQRLGPVIGRRPAQMGVARFDALEAPRLADDYAFHAKVFVPQDPEACSAVVAGAKAGPVGGPGQGALLASMSPPFKVLAAPPSPEAP